MMRTLHQTDLFRPHIDPDDHFDLASQFALARSGRIDLGLVLIDHPPTERFLSEVVRHDPSPRDPDVLAVARLNRWAGTAVPIAVGTAIPMESRGQDLHAAARDERQGVAAVIDFLRRSDDGVVIHIAGSARDIALAINEDPELFRHRCRGIYLNAGYGAPRSDDDEVEYNVRLNPHAFATVLDAPCPVFWMPCVQSAGVYIGAEYATMHDIPREEFLPELDAALGHYFESVLIRDRSSAWMPQVGNRLNAAVVEELMASNPTPYHGTFCTPGFLHAAGLTVTRGGNVVEVDHPDAIFDFVPITATVDDAGQTSWARGWSDEREVQIFRVTDPALYPAAMYAALRALLTGRV